jgi:methanogenic corrinoid protein MtbC1
MSASEDFENMFDSKGYERYSSSFAMLQTRLPESALQVLAREVIARMLDRRASLNESLRPLENQRLEEFCKVLTGPDPASAVDLISRMRADGSTIEQIYLGALSPAARRLGVWWDEDSASFAEVTIGISRIYGIMYGLRAEFPITIQANQRTAVFASVPGDDHTLGVSIAADLFRKDGWEIDLKLGMDHDTLVRELKSADAPIIGVSLGREESLPAMARLVLALRVSNPRAYIMVAGRFVAAHADTLQVTGADAAATDMPQALEEMEQLWVRVTVDRANARR